MLRVEFHCHTKYSKDSLTQIEDLLSACRRKDIDRLVITDHNIISGAVKAKAINPQLVIVGEEILTRQGELLAAYVKEEIPEGLDAFDAIRRLRLQGAFISVSHPFDRTRAGNWLLPDLIEIAPLVDAIEVFNSRCFPPYFNQQAERFARQHGLAGTVGSDAHTVFELGRSTMLLPDFEDAEGLRIAIKEIEYDTRLSFPWVRFSSRYAVIRKKFGG
jgi:predicted metal-dependent phosphoesterase TrpH